ncbi:hypothetical protein HK105_209314 [Polyrhizophydium stewartii]|uniref:Ankyrin repeat protein n=1 Tax=Polyrhizophydium stewartii TaxID=2732419 RepID=A0ABR4MVF1_9FUNG
MSTTANPVSDQPAASATTDTEHHGAARQTSQPAATRPAAPVRHRCSRGFLSHATNEWDRLPREIQDKILDGAGAFTKFVNRLLVKADLCGLSFEQCGQVWQDASDADWQGDVTLLPWADITVAPIAIRRSFLERHRRHINAEYFAAIAIRNGWTDLLEYDKPELLARAAARAGAVDILVDLYDVRKTVQPSYVVARNAAQFGQLEVIKLLFDAEPFLLCDRVVVELAVKGGNVDLVAWLWEHMPHLFSVKTMSTAACFNHMHIVRWLVDNSDIEPNIHVFRGAARVGNLELLQFLCERFPHVLETLEPGKGLSSASVPVIKWLEHRGLIDPAGVISCCVAAENIGLLEWAVARYNLEPSQCDIEGGFSFRRGTTAIWAIKRGFQLTELMISGAIRRCKTDFMHKAICHDLNMFVEFFIGTFHYGDGCLIEWWHFKYGIVFGQYQLEMAASTINIEILAHMLSMDGADWDLDAARRALETSLNATQRDIVDYMRETVSAARSLLDMAAALPPPQSP